MEIKNRFCDCGRCKYSWAEYDEDRSYHYCSLGEDYHKCNKFKKDKEIKKEINKNVK